jgi:hypothetical protein
MQIMKKLFFKNRTIGLLLILLISAAACVETDTGILAFDGDITIAMASDGHPAFQGYVKNTGNATVYNVEVIFIVYTSAADSTVLDRATAFPGELGDIAPDERISFEAVCANLTTVSQIVAYTKNITWLTRN